MANYSSSFSYTRTPANFVAPIFTAPSRPGYSDPYTAPMLADVAQMGQGQDRRINQQFDRNQGSLMGQLYSRGLGNSSLLGSFTLGNEDRRSQSLLDLAGQLATQRLAARQAGAGLSLQRYGIDAGMYGNELSSATSRYDAELGSATSRYGADMSADLQRADMFQRAQLASRARSGFQDGASSLRGSYPQQAGGVIGSVTYPGGVRPSYQLWG